VPVAIGGLQRNLSGPLQRHLLPGSLLGERWGPTRGRWHPARGAQTCCLLQACSC
jgi:hypothetical protein